MVISDFLDKHGYEDALRYLLARNMDIYVIHVLSQEEVEPELVGDLRLVDCEDDDVAEITISAPLLKRYKDNLNAFVGGLKEWCTSRGITYIFTTNQYPFRQVDPELPSRARAGPVNGWGELDRRLRCFHGSLLDHRPRRVLRDRPALVSRLRAVHDDHDGERASVSDSRRRRPRTLTDRRAQEGGSTRHELELLWSI